MITRIVFFAIAVAILCGFLWAYHHDAELARKASLVAIGDPNEAVRELLGEPSREGPCGSMSPAPSGCTDEYIYKYYYSIFQPEYEVVWFNGEGKVIGWQHVRKPF